MENFLFTEGIKSKKFSMHKAFYTAPNLINHFLKAKIIYSSKKKKFNNVVPWRPRSRLIKESQPTHHVDLRQKNNYGRSVWHFGESSKDQGQSYFFFQVNY
jgi:hypothetical protein